MNLWGRLRRLKKAVMYRFEIDPTDYRRPIKSYAQNGEDLILRRLFGGSSTGFYVDVGAHHPYRFSNFQLLYQQGWQGINIDIDARIKRRFDRIRPKDINLVFGVCQQAGDKTFYVFEEPALSTGDLSVAQDRVASGWRLRKEVNVPTERLDRLFEQYLPPDRQIDIMSIDTEGSEYEVVLSNDWARYRPKVVVLEVSLTQLVDGTSVALNYLERKSYQHYFQAYNSAILIANEHRGLLEEE